MEHPGHRNARIRRRWAEYQKVTAADLTWLFERSERLVVADAILAEHGYAVDEPGYQQPIPNG